MLLGYAVASARAPVQLDQVGLLLRADLADAPPILALHGAIFGADRY